MNLLYGNEARAEPKKEMNNMKGLSMNEAPKIILILVMIGVMLGAGLVALGAFQTSGSTTATKTENITLLNGSAVALTYDNDVSMTSLINATNASRPVYGYTVNLLAGTVTLTNNSWNDTEVTATYVYYTRDEFYNSTGYSIESATNISIQIPTIGTIIGVALLLVIIVGAFIGRKSRGI